MPSVPVLVSKVELHSAVAPRSTGLLPARTLPMLVLGLIALNIVSIVVGVSIGSVTIAPGTVWNVVFSEATGMDTSAGVPNNVRQIVWELRLPRVLLAGLVGAGLSIVGVAIQSLVRNPIADPYVLGVSSGASIGAALVILFGAFGGLGGASLTIAAFVTALASMTIVYLMALQGGRLDPLRLVLTGVVVGYVASAITSFLVFRGDPRAAQQVLFWLLGSFGRARWSMLAIPAIALVFGLVVLVIRSRPLDALMSGDEAAVTLGVPVNRLRVELFLLTAALTAVMVAVCGAVGFVGLVIPHMVRLIVGSLHRRVVLVSALLGSVFMMWVDLAARTIAAPQEIPVGIITALVGGPMFIVLMRHRDRRREVAS